MSSCVFSEITDFEVINKSERLGELINVYVDDSNWTIARLVVETGSWFSSSKLLLRSDQVLEIDLIKGAIHTALTKEEIEHVDTPALSPPVSEQEAGAASGLFGIDHTYPYYVGGYGGMVLPVAIPHSQNEVSDTENELAAAARKQLDPHLRSAKEISGYTLTTEDGELGKVTDLIIDLKDWSVRYVVIDTGKWLPGKQVVVEPSHILGVSWADRTLRVDKTMHDIKDGEGLEKVLDLKHSNQAQARDYYRFPL